MDGENNGKPYEQMDDLGGFPTIFGNTHIDVRESSQFGFQLEIFPCFFFSCHRFKRRILLKVMDKK